MESCVDADADVAAVVMLIHAHNSTGKLMARSRHRVFIPLLNRHAFVDRAVWGAWGVIRDETRLPLELRAVFPIGGPGRPYARAVRALLGASGNPIQIRYGANPLFRRLPPVKLDLRSEELPLTGSQVVMAAKCFMKGNFRLELMSLELTFDVDQYPIEYVQWRAFTRAQRRELQDQRGRKTLYFGAPRGHWQVRAYEKAPGVVRIEFVLRRPFLLEEGLRSVHDVLTLQSLDVWRLFCLCEFDEVGLRRSLPDGRVDWHRDFALHWPSVLPLQKRAAFLSNGFGFDPSPFLRGAALQRLLHEMQARLIW